MTFMTARTISVDYTKDGFALMPNPYEHEDGIVVPMCYVVLEGESSMVRSIFILALRIGNAYGYAISQKHDGEEFAEIITEKAIDSFIDILRMAETDDEGDLALDDFIIDLNIPDGYIMPYPPIIATR